MIDNCGRQQMLGATTNHANSMHDVNLHNTIHSKLMVEATPKAAVDGAIGISLVETVPFDEDAISPRPRDEGASKVDRRISFIATAEWLRNQLCQIQENINGIQEKNTNEQEILRAYSEPSARFYKTQLFVGISRHGESIDQCFTRTARRS